MGTWQPAFLQVEASTHSRRVAARHQAPHPCHRRLRRGQPATNRAVLWAVPLWQAKFFQKNKKGEVVVANQGYHGSSPKRSPRRPKMMRSSAG